MAVVQWEDNYILSIPLHPTVLWMDENQDNVHNAEEVDDHQKKKRGVDDWDDALHEVHDLGDTLDDVQNVQVDLAVAVGWECCPFSVVCHHILVQEGDSCHVCNSRVEEP